jgi:NAD-dependent DNA ligase
MKKNEIFERYIKAAYNFYNGKPVLMSDEDYDNLEKEVLKEYPDFNVRTYITMHQQGVSMEHHANFIPYTKSVDPSLTWEVLNDYGYVSPKYDGTSLVLYFREGECYQIITRADDKVGKNQYDKLIDKVNSLLFDIDPTITEVFCEAVTNLKWGDRSKANGLINSKYLQSEVDEKIELHPYGCSSPDANVRREFMEKYVHRVDKDEMDYIIENGKLENGIPVDGVVSYNIESNSIKMRKIYNNGSAITKITGHKLTYSEKTMTHSAVCKISKVFVDGANLSNVKPGPYGTMKKKGLGLGAEVEIIRAKKVIPKVNKVIKKSDDFSDIFCTGCNGKLDVIGKDLICKNEDCNKMNRTILNRLFKVLDIEIMKELIIAKYGNSYNQIIEGINDWWRSNKNKSKSVNKLKDLTISQLDILFGFPRFDSKKYNEEFNSRVRNEERLELKLKILNSKLSKLQKEHSGILLERIKYIFRLLELVEVI